MITTKTGTLRSYGLPLALIVIGGLAARYLHFSLTLGSDDQVWITVAKEIAAGSTPSDEPVYYTRLVWTWLLILWGQLGSIDLEWTAVLMFALSGLTMTFIAAATRTSFSERAALLAALVYAAHPLAITYDTATLPDGLAVCLLAATIWCFMRYLRAPRAVLLIVPGLLIGLLFGVKNYFMLVSIPCTLTILVSARDWQLRVKHVGVLAGASVVGLGLALLLGEAARIDASGHVASFGNYVLYVSQGPASASNQGIRQLIMLFAERTEALVTLFFGFGALMGSLTLFGLITALCESRREPAHLFMVSTALLFLLFLMFMPVRLSPLTFTQLHERYLTVLLPVLAIAAGVALAALWTALGNRALRMAAAGSLIAIVGYSAWFPNGMHDAYGRLELRGLAQIVTVAPERGTRQLLLPAYLRRLVPDSYRERSAQLSFVDLASPAGATAALDAIAADQTTAIMVFRTPYRTIREKLRTGDYDDNTAYGAFATLMHEAHARSYAVEEVRVPYDTARTWLARIGVPTRGQLVGWVVRKPSQ